MYERNKDPSLPYPDNILKAVRINEPVTDSMRKNIITMIQSPLLSDRESHCITEYYKNDRTYKDIGKDYNVTCERIRQVVMLGLNKLRKNKKHHHQRSE